MTKRVRNIIVAVVALQVIAILGVANLSYIIENFIPGQYWSYLPESVVATMGERDDYVLGIDSADVSEVDAADLIADINLEPAVEVVEATATPVPPTATPTEVPTEAPAEVAAEEATQETEAVPTATTEPLPTPLPTATLVPTPVPLPATFLITGIGHEAQEFNNCGPTNLTLVLNYYGNETSQLEAASYLKPNNQDRNVSPWQISDYVNNETELRSITRANGDQELLRTLLAAGFPVVIEKGYDPDVENARGWYGHYLTMVGYDDAAEEYYTRDTFLGPVIESDVKEGYTFEQGLAYSYEYIDYYWQQFNYTFYVVYEPNREAELYDILGTNLLDDFNMWAGAAQRAQQEIDVNGEDPFAWFNLGTALTRMGEITGQQEYYQNGAIAFDKSRSIGLPSRMMWYQHSPYVAYMKTGRYQDMLDLADATLVDPGGRNVEETYFYKGHAQSFLGDLDGAAASFRQSLKLNEFFYPAQFALDYVDSIRN